MELLLEVVVLLAVACLALAAGRVAGLPSIASYLLAGVFVGPGGIGLVGHSSAVETLAEIGVALLLFGVGTEISLEKMREGLLRTVGVGTAQVLASVTVVAGLFLALGAPTSTAVVVGFLVSLSSTALVLKLLAESGELGSPHGKAATGILVVQDFALIPMLLLLPALGGDSMAASVGAVGEALGRALVALIVILLVARFVLPRALDAAVGAGLAEMFASLALLVALGTALAAETLGLSLPLGAFLAGLALAGTAYAHRISAELLPLRDAFVAIFFTSVGVLCEPMRAMADPTALVGMAVAVFLKTAVCTVVVAVAWRSWRIGAVAGIALAQIGEFAFIIAHQASRYSLLPEGVEQAFLTCAVASMALTPAASTAVRRLVAREHGGASRAGRRSGHVVVAGCGSTGRAVANVLSATSIPFVVLELDARLAREADRDGLPVLFGDASRRAQLEQAGVADCRALVVCVGEPVATRRIVSLARALSSTIPILVRAHQVREIPELEQLGATEVVPAEFEASIELFVRMLTRLGVPRHVARVQEGIIRLGNYQALRGSMTTSRLMPEIEKLIRGGIIEHVEVLEGSRACGLTLGELDIREATGAAVLTLVRGDLPLANPGPEEHLGEGDLVVLYGPHAAIAAAIELFDPPREESAEA